MPRDERFGFLSRSVKALQESVGNAAPAASASYTLIGAIIFLGGLGYGFDAWRGTAHWGLITGLILGLAVGFYELVRSVWQR